MQQKIHMQDQVTNRIQMIMDEQCQEIKQAADSAASFVLIVVILAIGIVW
ncbi:MAG: hypothetical protein K9L22_03910 [Methylococcaceae bacterium]|nr:hypothetical protein [Methylococcaceae bacterium]